MLYVYKINNRWIKVLTYLFIIKICIQSFNYMVNKLLLSSDSQCLYEKIFWDSDGDCERSGTVMMLHKLLKAQHRSRFYLGEED